jgi:pimeloyl-ACP methyl ester carboxylesterase
VFNGFNGFNRSSGFGEMSGVRHVVYLHGFVSSPQSSKAQRFARELASRGVGYSCPDLNLPAFETLTVTRMLEQTREAIEAAGAGPVALVGSSLGGFVAVHAAAQPWARAVDRLVLLAPAFEFGGERPWQMPDRRVAEWRATGRMRVMHFAYDEWRDVGFALYEDASRYDAFALGDPVPTLIIQGRHDASVDPAAVERWAASRASVDLHLVDDEHQLAASTDYIWRESEVFLGLV